MPTSRPVIRFRWASFRSIGVFYHKRPSRQPGFLIEVAAGIILAERLQELSQ